MKRIKHPQTCHSWTLSGTSIWILLSGWFVAGGMILSKFGQLNRPGCALLLYSGIIGAVFGFRRLNGGSWFAGRPRWQRFRKPFPLLYLTCAAAALLGGLIHPPTNFDAFSYRIPRLLHWLEEGRWHWIGGLDPRMDFSATGSEWLMLPTIATFHSLGFIFLINSISYLLLPGLLFSVFSSLGVRKQIAAVWMWIIPCGSCFVMQAGSIGNDLIATVYVLSALHHVLRAGRTGSRSDIWLAVLSAALMTGAKASNLPLLLPIAISVVAICFRRPKLITSAVLAGAVSSVVSLAPLATFNFMHTGDWTGAPDSPLKLEDPRVGLAGNSLIIASASLAPAVFPVAEKVNQWFNGKLDRAPLKWIRDGFADFRFTHPQLASEENSGLGLGVTAALLAGMIGAIRHLCPKQAFTLGGAVFTGFWIALSVYMMKLGNCGAPRLIAPYYVGLIALPLLLVRSSGPFLKSWWRWSSLLVLAPILPALALNPARPLLPMRSIVKMLKSSGIHSPTLERMDVVYSVYADRSDAQRCVRELLPGDAKRIAFAGTSDESEYSFWLPLGVRTVTDFTPRPGKPIPDAGEFDAIVTSDWGCNDRFKMTPEQLADHLGWRIVGMAKRRTYASADPARWCVLVP